MSEDPRTGRTQTFKIKHRGYQIENELFWRGLENGWEKECMTLWKKLCLRSKVIFDVGANTGVYALTAAAINASAKIIALEPVQRVFKMLEENIRLNNFSITAVEKAASNKNGEDIIFDPGSENVYSVTVGRNIHSSDTTVVETRIQTVRLDTLAKDLGLGKVDLLKIDVETHEPEVLEGMGALLEKSKPVMLVEILTPEVAQKVQSIVKNHGYLFFHVDDESGPVQMDTITAFPNGYNWLLCDATTAAFLGLIFTQAAVAPTI